MLIYEISVPKSLGTPSRLATVAFTSTNPRRGTRYKSMGVDVGLSGAGCRGVLRKQ